jgi:hypothetical protein
VFKLREYITERTHTMNWDTAINILVNQQTAEDENENGAEMVQDALHAAYIEVKERCTTKTNGLGDWLENGDWSGDVIPGPAEIAQEWDDLSE